MKLTTKGRFAVTAMLDIALHDPEQYVTIAAIGERRHLSSAYLEQIFGKLRRAGLLEGIRGPTGGYRLSKPADQITVMQILDAVDASLEKSVCEKDRDCCDGEGECITFDLWDRLNEEMRRFLSGITLKGLAEQKLLKDQGIQKISIVRNLTEKSQTTPH
ncbi:Rrf2 family transcriptional regulator [Parasutterella muris]|jgi:Rrf2 family protein|uniref:Rrf2 family transcriptional regulator n=1 Tax=Parasutterella muris TaxID=2565572 RepID=A0A6L6YPC2_9BURK|nr:Rrf2 family transcriptional regulator [Parasutterella muris]MVX57361.1 Rrf2 family transcriptional regulator [Parasutterella muris]